MGEESATNEAPVEVDEEGQIDDTTGVVSPEDDVELNNDYVDDDLPPPPPPPLPHAVVKSNTAASKKKKIMIGAAVAVAACSLALGLGLGFGLEKNENSSSNASGNNNPSNLGDANTTPSTTEDGGGENGSGETFTPATVSAAATEAAKDSDDTSVVSNVDNEQVDAPEKPAEIIDPVDSVIDSDATDYTEYPQSQDETPVESIETYDAVIIGAGWSGIRATETLLNSGIDSLIVLEANDYIGGRSKSINLDGSINNPNTDASNIPHDIGSEWLYTSGAMEEAFLEKGGLIQNLMNNDKNSVDIMDATYYRQRRDVDGTLTAEEFPQGEEWFNEIWGGFLQFRENRLEDDLAGLSYQEAIDRYIERWEWTDDEYLQLLNLVEETAEVDYTADSSQLSIEEVEFFPPGYSMDAHYMGVPGIGFGNVAAEYAAPIKSKIRLNSKVTEINSEETDDGITIVKYVEGGKVKVVKAKTVLVTVSLGVLKAGNINFVPSLPANKQDSIDNMGFGVVNKCIMSWENDEDMVWPEDQLWMLLITPEDDTSGEWTQFSNPSKFKGKPSLTAWVGGEEALEAEQKTNAQIESKVMSNLRSMFPSIKDPDRVLISRWGQEANILGTYSFPMAGRDFYDDAYNLAERFNNIWFSGEATGSGWATTTGAWRTGERSANEMVEALQS